jgi:two-component system phosphate regulon sensor histidine kinase PhoR
MKKRIFRYYVILVIIGVFVTGFFTSQLAQMFYKYEVEDKLRNTANMIKYQVQESIASGKQPVDYNKLAQTYAGILNSEIQTDPSRADSNHSRITFIDYSGFVLGESETDFHSMDNHLNRKEVQEAIKGNIGKDTRFSTNLKVDFLYLAVPLDSEKIIVRVSVPLFQLNKIDRIIIVYTVLGILLGILFTIILALRFSSTITRPIKELISVSKEIAAGNFSKRASTRSNDEIGQLAKVFNETASKLENTLADMTDKNLKVNSIINSMIDGIVAIDSSFRVLLINNTACEMFGIKNGPGVFGINIIELIRNNEINTVLTETVQKNISQVSEVIIGAPVDKIYRVYTTPIISNNKESVNSGGIATIHDITNLKRLEQIRTEFVSNVTHELKTPLTSIRGFIETLKNGAIDNRDVSLKFLDIIDIESERLYTLINDILQLSEIETKQMDSDIKTHHLKTTMEEVFSILNCVAEKKGVTLTFEVDDNLMITANRDRIKQMLINLIDNGIKYNVEKGYVHVKAFREEGKVVFIIKDSGIGIAEEHIQRIFERFYRVDKGRSRNMGGTGLGLSIVKHIVNLYNGNIKVNSQVGEGSEFIIQLPSEQNRKAVL